MKINYLTSDPVVNRVISRLQARSEAGMKTYGVTMEDNPLSIVEWLRHAQEEALDLANYLETVITRLERIKETEVVRKYRPDLDL